MDKNIFIWSCNRRISAQIIAGGYYRINLAYKLNSEWILIIYSTHDISHCYPSWRFFLRRVGGLEAASVTVKILLGSCVYRCTKINLSDSSELEIGRMICDKIVNYQLDIALIFAESYTAEDSSCENFQITNLSNLSDDLQSMLAEGPIGDVTVKCDSFITKAHRNILSARSPVFKAMFESSMQENKAHIVVIDAMDPEVCQAMLTFIYSGQVKNLTMFMICSLLNAAEKYQIKGLKCGCVQRLKSILSIENALQILVVSDLYDSELKTDAISFICNHFSQLTATEEWKFFKSKKPLLVLEIYSNLDKTNSFY